MSGWAIVYQDVPGTDGGYMVFPHVVRPPAVEPVYTEGKTWGEPGTFWGREPDMLKAVKVSFRAEAAEPEGGIIYTVVMAHGLAKVLEANPALRRALLDRLSEGEQGLA